jgi:uncharacterized RDD family membrane protein YckC
MARWRDAKKQKNNNTEEAKKTEFIYGLCTSPLNRVKAFITDMFLIMMPIMYITTYIIMDGKDSFQGSETARWLTMIIYGVITVIFWVKKGQTPGSKAYDLILIDDKTQKTLSPLKATLRYILFIVSAVSILGFLIPFFRKDKKTFQDLVMQTSVIRIEEKTHS